jgi:hypothetical protein
VKVGSERNRPPQNLASPFHRTMIQIVVVVVVVDVDDEPVVVVDESVVVVDVEIVVALDVDLALVVWATKEQSQHAQQEEKERHRPPLVAWLGQPEDAEQHVQQGVHCPNAVVLVVVESVVVVALEVFVEIVAVVAV